MKKYSCEHAPEKRRCRVCYPKGWALHLLRKSKARAREFDYIEACGTYQEVVEMAKAVHCVLCLLPLNWSPNRENKEKLPCLHHDHVTGEIHGFVHEECNMTEPIILRDKKILELEDIVQWQQILIMKLQSST